MLKSKCEVVDDDDADTDITISTRIPRIRPHTSPDPENYPLYHKDQMYAETSFISDIGGDQPIQKQPPINWLYF